MRSLHKGKEEAMAKKKKGTNTGIPGLTFSVNKATGITNLKRKIAKETGIPTTKQGRKRKIEHTIGKMFGL